jgi:hypothetical protein
VIDAINKLEGLGLQKFKMLLPKCAALDGLCFLASLTCTQGRL